MPRSHKQSISFRLFHQNHSWISLLPHAGHIFCLCLHSLITLITFDSALEFYFLYSKGMNLCIYENKTGLHRVRKHYNWYTYITLYVVKFSTAVKWRIWHKYQLQTAIHKQQRLKKTFLNNTYITFFLISWRYLETLILTLHKHLYLLTTFSLLGREFLTSFVECTALHRIVQNCLSVENAGPVQQHSTITKMLTKCIHISSLMVLLLAITSFMAQQPPVGQGLLNAEASWSHSDTPYLVRLNWISDQPNT
jgi:hypothetical protein